MNAYYYQNPKMVADYDIIPLYRDNKQFVCCWTLTLWERVKILFTGTIWLHQIHGDKEMQPTLLDVNNPFRIDNDV